MTIQVDAPVLCTLDADLGPEPALRLQGEPPVAIACLDHATLSPIAQERASRFALIIAASSWTESVLRANGIVATVTVPFGVDTALFHPAPRTGQFRDRFVVFSGGGLDDRAGQDLVVKAFRIFHQRHNNAVLVTTWPSPDAVTWAIGHGIPGDALIALGPVPEIAMPHVLREADVALFPSRAEGGTNPLAMAAMACGVPVILSAHTGHLDLLNAGDVALRLDRQTPLDHPGWAESDIEEILEYLETVWRDPDAAAALGARGAALMAPMTWQRHADALLEAIDPLLP
jgi:glycosyltransferase involved in cell wall biosynthesis